MSNKLITFGTDPEFFVKVKYDNTEEVIEPSTMFFMDDDGLGNNNVHNDGYQAELSVKSSDNIPTMLKNIQEALQVAKDRMDFLQSNVLKNISSYEFLCLPAIKVTKSQIAKGGEQCAIFGCKPDYNVYLTGDKVNKSMVDAQTHMFRYSGGHIHYGENKLTKRHLQSPYFLQLCDILIGNTLVYMDKSSLNSLRSKNYGRAGTFRTPSYGVEYRTLSSYWLSHPQLANFVFQLADLCATITHKKLDYKIVNGLNESFVFKATIDNFNRTTAENNLNDVANMLEKLKIKHPVFKDAKSFKKKVNDLSKLKLKNDILSNWGIR